MNMKVGQWAKIFDENNEYYTIIKIKGVNENSISFYIGYNNVISKNCVVKSADNLEDLLEVGDIVHGKIEKLHGDLIKIEDFEMTIIDLLDLDQIRIMVNVWGGLTITAIELHENRIKQNICM